MRSSLRVGLIGFGRWARQAYGPALRELASVRVAAVAARSPASREAAQQTFGADVATYGDFRTLIDEGDVDAVMIALPGALHAEAVEAAVRAGRHVFFEPPIALTREATEAALETIAAASSVVQVDFELRYLPVMDAVVDLIGRGAIGAVRLARVSLWCDWGRDGALSRLGEEGIAYALGPWYLDVLDAVVADTPRQACVTGGYAFNGRLLDHGWATLCYDGGQVGCFEINLLAPEGADVRLHVVGNSGEIEADLLGGNYRWRAEDGEWRDGAAPPSLPKCGFVGMRECIVDFVSAVTERRPARTTPDVIRRVHQAMLLCAEAERR